MKKYKFVCTLDFGDVLGQTILWIILIVITLGIALPFFAYFFLRLIINKTEIHEFEAAAISQGKKPLNIMGKSSV